MSDSRLELVLASRNAHKCAELERMLEGRVGLEPLDAGVELPPETGKTFLANARIKALGALAATGLAAIADDSGIEAAALNGRPGVRSARYAGPDASDAENLAKLRAEVAPGTALRYVCVIVVRTLDGAELTAEGIVEGTMSAGARGSGGFGYDPVFLPVDVADSRTMAQLSPGEKDAISHRGRAARALLARLDAL